MPATSSRISASSSTMRISVGIVSPSLAVIVLVLRTPRSSRPQSAIASTRRARRESFPKRRGAQYGRHVLRGCGRRSRPRALFTRGHVRLKEARAVLFWQSYAIVDDIDDHVFAVALSGHDNAAAPEF